MTPDVINLLQRAEESKLYGTVELHFQNGHVVLMRKSETFKPTVEEVNHAKPTRQ
jgi:hypothetical protein